LTVVYSLAILINLFIFSFFFQAEDGIRDFHVTGVQTCALPIFPWTRRLPRLRPHERDARAAGCALSAGARRAARQEPPPADRGVAARRHPVAPRSPSPRGGARDDRLLSACLLQGHPPSAPVCGAGSGGVPSREHPARSSLAGVQRAATGPFVGHGGSRPARVGRGGPGLPSPD